VLISYRPNCALGTARLVNTNDSTNSRTLALASQEAHVADGPPQPDEDEYSNSDWKSTRFCQHLSPASRAKCHSASRPRRQGAAVIISAGLPGAGKFYSQTVHQN